MPSTTVLRSMRSQWSQLHDGDAAVAVPEHELHEPLSGANHIVRVPLPNLKPGCVSVLVTTSA